MSRLRRLVLLDRFFFLTVKLLPERRPLDAAQFAVLARCLSAVRCQQRFWLTAPVFLPGLVRLWGMPSYIHPTR